MIIILAIFGTPLLFGYNFSNWVVEYFSVPIFASLLATIICFSLWTRKKIKITFWIYLFALILNGGFQALSLFGKAFGGGNYPSHYQLEPDWKVNGYDISEFNSHGFAGPPFRQIVIYKTILNGLLYKEVARTTENDTTKCEIIFYKNLGRDRIIFDSCEETLRMEKNVP